MLAVALMPATPINYKFCVFLYFQHNEWALGSCSIGTQPSRMHYTLYQNQTLNSCSCAVYLQYFSATYCSLLSLIRLRRPRIAAHTQYSIAWFDWIDGRMGTKYGWMRSYNIMMQRSQSISILFWGWLSEWMLLQLFLISYWMDALCERAENLLCSHVTYALKMYRLCAANAWLRMWGVFWSVPYTPIVWVHNCTLCKCHMPHTAQMFEAKRKRSAIEADKP